jgi:GNAT superfamily N-acetyltransferase
MKLEIMQSTPEEKDFIDNIIVDFNVEQVPATQEKHWIPFNYCFKNNGVVIASINAEMYLWHILYISILFVDKKYRRDKLGSYLLEKVEIEAKKMGARLVHLDTFDFQAKDFYTKHGYEVFGILEDCPVGHKRYYMKKRLK